MNTATVTGGPSVWFGKSGPVLQEEDDFVVVSIDADPDINGRCTNYHLRLPRTFVTFDCPVGVSWTPGLPAKA